MAPKGSAMATPGQDRVERRLAAILAADVAGYSRLTGLDEEGTHIQGLTHDVIVNEGDARQADFFASQGIVEIMLPFSPAAMLILSFEGSHSHSVIRARRYQRRH